MITFLITFRFGVLKSRFLLGFRVHGMGSSPITGSEDLVDCRIYKVFFYHENKRLTVLSAGGKYEQIFICPGGHGGKNT